MNLNNVKTYVENVLEVTDDFNVIPKIIQSINIIIDNFVVYCQQVILQDNLCWYIVYENKSRFYVRYISDIIN